jgi:glutaredoxin
MKKSEGGTGKNKENKETDSKDSSNIKLYMVSLFLFGIILGALGGYGYSMSQKTAEGKNATELNASLETSNENASVEKAFLFIKEGLNRNGFDVTLDSVSEIKAKRLVFSIFAGTGKVETVVSYLINGSVITFGANEGGYYYNIANYVPKNETLSAAKSDKPNIKFFVMSFCPFGQQAENALRPVVELLGTTIDAEPHFVIYSGYADGSEAYCMNNGTYCSMHGINELKEDVRQLCIWKYEKEKWWKYNAYVNENCTLNTITTCWEEAAEAVGIEKSKIKDCEEKEALTLLAAETQLNEKYGVSGSPTVFINDILYNGARTPEAYKKAICAAFNVPPNACNKTITTTTSTTPASGGCGG